MDFQIDEDRASEWISGWEDSFDSIKPDPSSMKTLIYLTLLERRGKMTSYQDIADELKRRGILEREMDKFTPLRNGMNQVIKALKKTESLYEIESSTSGREASFRLKRRSQSPIKRTASSAPRVGEIVKILDDPELTASMEFKYVAEKLIRDRRMPFYGIYLPMPAASRWVLYSEGEAKQRSKLEGEECERLLHEWLSKYHGKEISIIGLGVGEGIGEIEIIRRLLEEDKVDKKYDFSRIHYCAIDTSVHLLMDHIERLNHKFTDAIKTNRLVCGVICGNFLEDFSKLIQRLRDEFVETGQLSDSDQGFLPNTGSLISILGNLVGNLEKRASEWSYFEPVLNELKGYDLAFLLGVSVQQERKKPEKYEKDLEELLLATPRYLTHELTMLKSGKSEKDKEEREFFLPEDENERIKRWPRTEDEDLPYLGDGLVQGERVEGKIYEFYYKTKWDLSMSLDKEDLRIPGGTNLLLYNIIKFDEDSLINFLKSKGLVQPSQNQEPNPHPIHSGNENRQYVIIAVTNKPPE